MSDAGFVTSAVLPTISLIKLFLIFYGDRRQDDRA
jgi:hypothetical protein